MLEQGKHQCSESSGIACRAGGKVSSGLPDRLAIIAFETWDCELNPDRTISNRERPESPKMIAAQDDIPAITIGTA